MSKPIKVAFYTKGGEKVAFKAHRTTKRVKYYQTLEYKLCEVLQRCVGERGGNEGVLETLERVILERDQALLCLALDRLRRT